MRIPNFGIQVHYRFYDILEKEKSEQKKVENNNTKNLAF